MNYGKINGEFCADNMICSEICVFILRIDSFLVELGVQYFVCIYRFIGELFKLKMLTENIMHDCVFKLLRTKDPESLECLCRLLTTIGKELDTDKARVSQTSTTLVFHIRAHILTHKRLSELKCCPNSQKFKYCPYKFSQVRLLCPSSKTYSLHISVYDDYYIPKLNIVEDK